MHFPGRGIPNFTHRLTPSIRCPCGGGIAIHGVESRLNCSLLLVVVVVVVVVVYGQSDIQSTGNLTHGHCRAVEWVSDTTVTTTMTTHNNENFDKSFVVAVFFVVFPAL